MAKVTDSDKNRFKTGDRIKECRKLRGLSQAQLIEKIELLPDNHGKDRNEKQIAYLESGARTLSLEYATLIAQALQVRAEYLLLKDDYMTENDKFCASLDRMEESAKILHSVIRLAANSQGCDIESVDLTEDDDPVLVETDSLYYVFKKDGMVIAHLSLMDYSKLRNEIYHYSCYLVEKYCKQQETQLVEPYAMEKTGGRNNG